MKAPGSSVQFSHTSICTDDSDEFRTWELAVGIEAQRMQLSRGRGVYEADIAVFGELGVWRYLESHRIITDFSLPAGTVEICFARCPDAPVWCGMELPKSTVVIHHSGKAYRTVLPAGAETYGVVLPETSMLLADVVPDELLARVRSAGQATAFVPKRLLDRVLPLFDVCLEGNTKLRPDAARDVVLTCCHEVIDECFPDRHAGAQLPNRKLVDEATTLIGRRLHDELTVQEVLSVLGVSRRALERAFRQHLGVTPLKYLLAKRLHLARRMLVESQASILDVCLNAGFNHPSRFTEMYARHFGELPSQTRKRTR